MHKGYTIDQIHELTKIDKWFLEKLKHIIDIDESLKRCTSVNVLDKELLRTAKVYGFTDFQIARAVGLEQEMGNMHKASMVVRNLRKSYGILPVVKQKPTTSTSPIRAWQVMCASTTTAVLSLCLARVLIALALLLSSTGVVCKPLTPFVARAIAR